MSLTVNNQKKAEFPPLGLAGLEVVDTRIQTIVAGFGENIGRVASASSGFSSRTFSKEPLASVCVGKVTEAMIMGQGATPPGHALKQIPVFDCGSSSCHQTGTTKPPQIRHLRDFLGDSPYHICEGDTAVIVGARNPELCNILDAKAGQTERQRALHAQWAEIQEQKSAVAEDLASVSYDLERLRQREKALINREKGVTIVADPKTTTVTFPAVGAKGLSLSTIRGCTMNFTESSESVPCEQYRGHKRIEMADVCIMQHDGHCQAVPLPEKMKERLATFLRSADMDRADCGRLVSYLLDRSQGFQRATGAIGAWKSEAIDKKALKVGDAVSFNSTALGGKMKHVAVYLGDGLYFSKYGYGGPLAVSSEEEIHEAYNTDLIKKITPPEE